MRLTCLVDNCATSTLWGEHGLSFFIQTGSYSVIWDTGQSGDVLVHNLRELELEGLPLTACALSHGHIDHTGGLDALLSLYPKLPIYAHPDVFRGRYSLRDGARYAIGIAEQEEDLRTSTTFQLSD